MKDGFLSITASSDRDGRCLACRNRSALRIFRSTDEDAAWTRHVACPWLAAWKSMSWNAKFTSSYQATDNSPFEDFHAFGVDVSLQTIALF